MTDVARRQARTQKQRLDTALLERRRRDALADLGESLYDLASRGEIELDELPELVRGVQEVDDIDREIAEAEQAGASSTGRRPVRLERTRSDRLPAGGRSRERVWRPVDPDAGGASDTGDADNPGDTGTAQAASDRGGRGDEGGIEAEFATGRRAASTRSEARGADWSIKRSRARASADTTPERPPRRAASAAAPRRGGIVFVDDDAAPADRDPDDSLESYMNEDDVPRRR